MKSRLNKYRDRILRLSIIIFFDKKKTYLINISDKMSDAIKHRIWYLSSEDFFLFFSYDCLYFT